MTPHPHHPIRRIAATLAAAIVAATSATSASAQFVRVRNLDDLVLGSLATPQADRVVADDICVHSAANGARYAVTVRGSGPGGAFALSGNGYQIPIEVQWAFAPGQTTGIALTPGVALTGRSDGRTNPGCNAAPTASLVVIARAADVAAARAGNYTGSLTITVGPN